MLQTIWVCTHLFLHFIHLWATNSMLNTSSWNFPNRMCVRHTRTTLTQSYLILQSSFSNNNNHNDDAILLIHISNPAPTRQHVLQSHSLVQSNDLECRSPRHWTKSNGIKPLYVRKCPYAENIWHQCVRHHRIRVRSIYLLSLRHCGHQ